MRLRKRQLGLLFLLLISIFAYSIWINHNSAQMLSNDDFIRFHVVANSNTADDQALKLSVRDGLIETINEGLIRETMTVADKNKDRAYLDIERSKEYIRKNLIELERKARLIIAREGHDYPVTADLEVVWIPQKTYGDITFPAGNYEALNVRIGEAKGENWWCVLFPPLCLIDTNKDNDAEDVYKDALFDEKYRELWEENGKPRTLELRFKVLELFK